MSRLDTIPPATARKSLRWKLWLKLLAGGAFVSIAALASAGPLTKTHPADRIADDKLAVRITAAIANDPELKSLHLNLLVNVVKRDAVIGGPVPDMKLLPRIEAVAKAVNGVGDVKVSGWVPTGSVNQDPFARKVAEQMQNDKPLPVEPPRSKPVGETEPASPLPPVVLPAKTESTAVAPKAAAPVPPVTVKREGEGVLQDPVAPATSRHIAPSVPPGAAPLPYPNIPPTKVPTVPASHDGLPEAGHGTAPVTITPAAPALPSPSLSVPAPAPTTKSAPVVNSAPTRLPEADPMVNAIEAIRRANPQFRDLKVEMRGKAAVIRGQAADDRAKWTFAQQIRRIDGIERVIVGSD